MNCGTVLQPGIGATQCHLLAVGRMAGKMLEGGRKGAPERCVKPGTLEDKYTRSKRVESLFRGQMITDESWARNRRGDPHVGWNSCRKGF